MSQQTFLMQVEGVPCSVFTILSAAITRDVFLEGEAGLKIFVKCLC